MARYAINLKIIHVSLGTRKTLRKNKIMRSICSKGLNIRKIIRVVSPIRASRSFIVDTILSVGNHRINVSISILMARKKRDNVANNKDLINK